VTTGLDTNVLARYYVEDQGDAQAQRQRIAAQAIIESGQPLAVAKTVLLELEWVLRGYYALPPADVVRVLSHLLGLTHVHIEDRGAVETAVALVERGLDFADALHHASYRDCDAMASFDDKRFARHAAKLGLAPRVVIPS
jgi:predicted nucleic-acid-binding protein